MGALITSKADIGQFCASVLRGENLFLLRLSLEKLQGSDLGLLNTTTRGAF